MSTQLCEVGTIPVPVLWVKKLRQTLQAGFDSRLLVLRGLLGRQQEGSRVSRPCRQAEAQRQEAKGGQRITTAALPPGGEGGRAFGAQRSGHTAASTPARGRIALSPFRLSYGYWLSLNCIQSPPGTGCWDPASAVQGRGHGEGRRGFSLHRRSPAWGPGTQQEPGCPGSPHVQTGLRL